MNRAIEKRTLYEQPPAKNRADVGFYAAMSRPFDDLKASWETHRYDAVHPEVWNAFVDRAFELIRGGKRRIGAKNIFEDIRRTKIFETGDKVYMLDNSMTPYCARKFEHFYPRYKGYFEMCRRAGARVEPRVSQIEGDKSNDKK